MKRQEHKSNYWSPIKKWTIITLLTITALLVSYGVGTFMPNTLVVEKIRDAEDRKMVTMAREFGLHEPEFIYNDNESFIDAVERCILYLNWTLPLEKRIPSPILIAMAVIESDHGKSRFAVEGNALFGVRTWDLENVPHMKPMALPNASFGVRKYPTKCQSVQDVIEIINRHPAYESFRTVRKETKHNPDIERMVHGLAAWSTNEMYATIIIDKIQSLTKSK